MTLQELTDEFRRQAGDVSKPTLWSDDEILAYIVDAQDMWVRQTGGISDSTTTAVTDLPVGTNEPYTDHSPCILRIRSAKLLTAKRSLKIAQESDISTLRIQDYGILYPSYLDDTDTGEVIAMVLGIEKNAVRWFKVPAAEDICRLHVYRLPYPRIVDTDGCLEIDEQHHRHLIMWMKHLAYSKEDAETYDKDLANANAVAFTLYCEKANQEEERQRYRPRQMQYGGIPW